jgi:uncharacterized protein YggE
MLIRNTVLAGAIVAVLIALQAGQIYISRANFGVTPVNAQVTATPAPSTLAVQGIGRASGAPDVARVTIGVESVGPEVGKAVADVNSKQAAIVDKLKALGIADKDIQTTNFSVNVDRSKPPQAGVPAGPVTYDVVNTAQVTIRKLDQLAAVIDAAVGAGANNIYGISLSIDDTTALANDARAKAVAEARSHADTLAKAAGMKVTRIISISEIGGGIPQPVFAADSRAASSAFQPGELQISAQVQVVYAIEPP